MAQNFWPQEWISFKRYCKIWIHWFSTWLYLWSHCPNPILSHIHMLNSLSLACQIQNCTTAVQHELVLDSKKTNQLCKEPSKTETKKTQSCNEFEQETKPVPACCVLMIHDIPADKWILQTCWPLPMQTRNPVPWMCNVIDRGHSMENIPCDCSKQLQSSTSAFAMDSCAKHSWHWDVLSSPNLYWCGSKILEMFLQLFNKDAHSLTTLLPVSLPNGSQWIPPFLKFAELTWDMGRFSYNFVLPRISESLCFASQRQTQSLAPLPTSISRKQHIAMVQVARFQFDCSVNI